MLGTRTLKILISLTLALVLTTPLVPVSAHPDEEPDRGPLLEQGADLPDGWHVWELTVDEAGTDVFLWRLAEDMRYPIHLGWTLYTAEGELLSWSTLQGWRGEGVKVETAQTGPVVDTWHGELWGDFGINSFIRDLDAGDYVLAEWRAAGEATWVYDLHGPNTQITGSTSGDDAFVHTTVSFDGPVNAQAWLGGPTSTHVLLDGTVDLAIEDTLLFYGHSRALTPVFELDAPDGDTHACSCTLFEATGEAALGPGAYTIRASGASHGEIIAGGADVQLPFGQT